MSGKAARRPEVLLVHQSADLYGSDRVLRSLVLRLRSGALHPVVLLPAAGPLHDSLVAEDVEVHIVPLAKLTRATGNAAGMAMLPWRLAASLLRLRALLADRDIRLVYSNTLAVVVGAVYARMRGLPHIWHVHEIVGAPRLAAKAFPMLLRWLADRVICNSHQTRNWLVAEQAALAGRAVTVVNGVERPASNDRAAAERIRIRCHACGAGVLLVTLVGRINRMKGQSLLVEAAELLLARGYRNLRFAMVGSPPPGQEEHFADLRARVARSPARACVTLPGFADQIWPIWQATDIAVVPSIEPESFGLVAAEAMAAGKPVIASALGGLVDIVVPEVSGLLVKPGDAVALADAIARLADDADLRTRLGNAGRMRQQELFSLAGQLDRLEDQIAEMISA